LYLNQKTDWIFQNYGGKKKLYTMGTFCQFGHPTFNMGKAGLVGHVKAVDCSHDSTIEQLTERGKLVLAR
jgi:hypothetical protein